MEQAQVQENQDVGGEGQEVQNEDVSTDEGYTESASNDSESTASEMGWVPKDEYRGDPDKWVDAETFVARGKKSGPILKERNEHLIKEIQTLKQEFAKHKEVTEQFKQFQVELRERKESEYKAQINELRMQKSEAIRNGDGDAVNDIDDRIDAIKERTKEVAKVEQPQQQGYEAPHPDFDAWKAENSWFTNDKKLQAYAFEMAKEMRETDKVTEGRVFFDKVKEAVRKDFPSKFGNPNRTKPGAVETGNTMSYKGKTMDDIPSDERKVIKGFISQGLYKNEAEAVKAYFN